MLFWATPLVSFHVLPALWASVLTVLLHVSAGLPAIRVPCGFQSKAFVWLDRCCLFVECGQSNSIFSSNVNYNFFKFRCSTEFFVRNCLWSINLQNLVKNSVDEILDFAILYIRHFLIFRQTLNSVL